MKRVFFVSLLSMLLLTGSALAQSDVGRLLEEALSIRSTGLVSEVAARFSAALEATSNPYQRNAIYSLFSDYLKGQREWEMVVALQQQALSQKDTQNQAGPLFNLILAYLELNQVKKARAVCAEFLVCPSAKYLREYIQRMKNMHPHSIYTRIADLMATTPAASRSPELAMSFVTKDVAVSLPVAYQTPLERAPQYSVQENYPTGIEHEKQIELRPEKVEPKALLSENISKRVKVQLGGWQSGLSGELQSPNTYIDLDSDVSLNDRTAPVISAEVFLTHKDRLKVSYLAFSHSGSLTRPVVFSKTTFGVGSSVTLETRFADVEGLRILDESPRSALGLLYGAKYNDSEINLDQYGTGFHRVGSGDSEFWFPYLGVYSTSRLGRNLGFDGSLKWFSWSGSDRINTHDLELKLLFGGNFAKRSSRSHLFGFLGYRNFRMNGALDEKSSIIRFAGPIFGLEWQF